MGRGKRGKRGAKSGRGTKGALKRGKMRLYFEGGALPLTKRMPMFRGKGKNKPRTPAPVIIHLERLNSFRNDSVVTLTKLSESKIVDKDSAEKRGVKILDRGELKKKLKIKDIPISKSAGEKVKQAGGEII